MQKSLLIRTQRQGTIANVEIPQLDSSWTIPLGTRSISFFTEVHVKLPWGVEQTITATSAPITDDELGGQEVEMEALRVDSSSAAVREAVNLALGFSIDNELIDPWRPVPNQIGIYTLGNVVVEVKRVQARIEIHR